MSVKERSEMISKKDVSQIALLKVFVLELNLTDTMSRRFSSSRFKQKRALAFKRLNIT
jgi:hypothetical protein